MIRSILVPLDGSAFAEHALPFALRLAADGVGTIQLLLVHQALELWDTGRPAQIEERWTAELHQGEARYLAEVADRVRAAAGAAAVDAIAREGFVAPTIADHARERGVDMIVLTTHARSGLERTWLGSVADELVRTAGVPLLLVRPLESEEVRSGPAEAIRRILVAWDGSDEAEAVLDHAVDLALLTGAHILIAQSVTPYSGPASPYIPHSAAIDADMLDERTRAARARVAEAAERVLARAERPGAVETIVETHATPARGVLNMAAAHRADMIAVGTHGRKGVRRALLGSVADKVIRSSALPVLVCRRHAAHDHGR